MALRWQWSLVGRGSKKMFFTTVGWVKMGRRPQKIVGEGDNVFFFFLIRKIRKRGQGGRYSISEQVVALARQIHPEPEP